MPAVKGGHQGVLVHQAPAGGVDEERALGHQGELSGAHHLLGLRGEFVVERYAVGLGKEFVEGEVTDPQFGLFLGREPVAFVVNDVTPERHQKLGRNPSDPADADQPDGLAQDGFEQFQAHPVVGVVDLVGDEGFHPFHDHPVHETLVTGGQALEEGQDHHHGVLGNAGRPGGHDAFGPHS